MPALDEETCLEGIDEIFGEVTDLTPIQIAHAFGQTRGKLYELYCVARLLAELHNTHHWLATFTGTVLRLKSSGGFALLADPHFNLHRDGALVGRLYTDVEVMTLGAVRAIQQGASISDYSAYHEIDVVVVAPQHGLRPMPEQLILGLECKATADFDKAFVREVLGRRRELSYLSPAVGLNGPVMADPPSDYRLVYIDPAGDMYRQSPSIFEVQLTHWLP